MISFKFAFLLGALLAVIVTVYEWWMGRTSRNINKAIKKWVSSMRDTTPEEQEAINKYVRSKYKKIQPVNPQDAKKRRL